MSEPAPSSWWRRAGRLLVRAQWLLLALGTPLLLFPGRFVLLGLFLLALPWLGRLAADGQPTRSTPLDAPLLLILFLAIVGYVISVEPAMSRARLWGLLLQLAIFYAVANGVTDSRGTRRLVILLLPLTAAVALLSLVGTNWTLVRLVSLPNIYSRLPILVHGLPGSGVPVTTSLFHPREVGATMAFLLPVPLTLVAVSDDRRLRLAAAATAALALLVLLLSQALMGYFGLLLALCLLLVWWRPYLLALVLLGPVAALTAVLVYGPARLAALLLDFQHPLGAGIVLRFDMWSRALAMVRDMPFTGIGLNTFSVIQSQFYPGYYIGPEVHAHNLWLQTALDLGLPGLLALLLLLVAFSALLLAAYRHAPRQEQPLLVALAAALLAYVAGGTLDVVSLGAKPVSALWVLIGLATAIYLQHVPVQTRLRRLITIATGTLVLLALGALFLLPGVWHGNLGTVRAQQALLQARHSGVLPAPVAATAVTHLEQARSYLPDRAQFHAFLGSLYAWQGRPAAAMAALRQRVALDGPYALDKYAPFVGWRHRLTGTPPLPPWQGTISLYSHWRRRFPQRAEPYALSAIVEEEFRGEESRAEQVRAEGRLHQAQPVLLLQPLTAE